MTTIENIMALAYKLRDARTYEWDVSEFVEASKALRTALTEALAFQPDWADFNNGRECGRIEATEVLAAEQSQECRTLYECRGCGHIYGEKVSSCDCLENGTNEYNEWTASPKGNV